MERKYRLTGETIQHRGKKLFQIVALKSFGEIKKGEVGGYIERDINLSQSGKCWIHPDARVWGFAKVMDDAIIAGEAEVCDEATVKDKAMVYHHAQIQDKAVIEDNARVFDMAFILGNSRVSNNALVRDIASIGYHATIKDNAKIGGKACVNGYGVVSGYASVDGECKVTDKAVVTGNTQLTGRAYIGKDTIITETSEYMVFKNTWSSGRYFTWTKTNNKWFVGCFYGTGEELLEKAKNDSQQKYEYYKLFVDLADKIRIMDNENEELK